MGALTELSLFTGYGGFSLGLRLAGVPTRTVCYVEWDKYCQQLITQRIEEGHMDDAPLWDDVKTFDGRPWRGCVDIITGGFPCQPHSVAGQQRGEADERNLWPDTLRLIRDVEPRYVLLENVPGILSNGYGGTVVGELAEVGYDCIWDCVPAAAVGAPHLRWRWWCLAYTPSGGLAQQAGEHNSLERSQLIDGDGQDGDVADAHYEGLQRYWGKCRLGEGSQEIQTGRGSDVADANVNGAVRHQPEHGQGGGIVEDGDDLADAGRLSAGWASKSGEAEGWGSLSELAGSSWWATEPPLGRVANGVAHRVDQLKALGNGIVPAVVAEFLRGQR
jgi:DNA (cytosine-5)-methyltransferase 1